jgi:hypothetical protein
VIDTWEEHTLVLYVFCPIDLLLPGTDGGGNWLCEREQGKTSGLSSTCLCENACLCLLLSLCCHSWWGLPLLSAIWSPLFNLPAIFLQSARRPSTMRMSARLAHVAPSKSVHQSHAKGRFRQIYRRKQKSKMPRLVVFAFPPNSDGSKPRKAASSLTHTLLVLAPFPLGCRSTPFCHHPR